MATLIGDNALARELLNAGLPEVGYSPSFEAGFLGTLVLLEVYEDDLREAERHSSRAMHLCRKHNLEGVVFCLPAYAGATLVAARLGRVDEAHVESLRARRLLARLGDISARSSLRGYVALAQAALALGEYAEARVHARDAGRARRRDPSSNYLNELLDQVETILAEIDTAVLDVAPISAAELRVLTYLPTHLPLREIADAVYLSRNTVKTHVVAIYRKLGVSSRGEAVARARQVGLLETTEPNPPDLADLV